VTGSGGTGPLVLALVSGSSATGLILGVSGGCAVDGVAMGRRVGRADDAMAVGAGTSAVEADTTTMVGAAGLPMTLVADGLVRGADHLPAMKITAAATATNAM
jgi:hypothetical protein